MPAYGILLGFADMSEAMGYPCFAAIRKRSGETVGWIARQDKKGDYEFVRNALRKANRDEQAEIDKFIAAKERRRKRKGGKRK